MTTTGTREQRAASAYLAGATLREVAAEHAVNESTIRAWLAAAGVPRRKPGQRPVADDVTEQIVTLRRRNRLPWEQVAAAAGVSKTAARRTYERATGDRGRVDHHKHLTARQADRILELLAAVPDNPVGPGQATSSSAAGRRLAGQLRAHIAAGVTQRELAETCHRSSGWIGRILTLNP